MLKSTPLKAQTRTPSAAYPALTDHCSLVGTHLNISFILKFGQPDAPPERALEAVKQATPAEMPLVRTLFTVRSLPAILARRQGLPTEKTKPLYEQMLASGFHFLAE
jgi:hypothetical protein